MKNVKKPEEWFETIDDYAVDFPEEGVWMRRLKSNYFGNQMYWKKHTDKTAGVTYDSRIYGPPQQIKVEYERDKAILDHCFDLYSQARAAAKKSDFLYHCPT